MKKFFQEFKKFIMRGNVLDLAVGVIIGSAFTAIVTSLTENILKPFINWIIFILSGSNGSLEGVYTFLVGSEADLSQAIYIDWGAFISAIINFLLVAFILFLIIKAINKLEDNKNKMFKNVLSGVADKETRKGMKAKGLNYKNPKEVIAYKKALAEEEKLKLEAEKKEQEEKERLERLQNPSTTDLLKQIKEILENKEK